MFPRTELQEIEAEVRTWPGVLRFELSERASGVTIEFIEISAELRGQGTGSKAVKLVTDYATRYQVPVLLNPNPYPRKRAALFRFYRRLGFIPNRGRKARLDLGSPFGGEWIFLPKFNVKFQPGELQLS